MNSKAGLPWLGAALLAAAVAASSASAQYPAVKNAPGEVKRDADLNKAGSAKPSGNYVRVPTQPGRIQQDSDWNKGARANIFTPPLRFIGDAEPPGTVQAHRPITTPPLSFVGMESVRPADTVVHVKTDQLNFVGADQ